MMTARVRPRTALVATTLLVAGCGLLDYEYEPAGIRDAVKGVVPSTSQRYRVPAPQIPILRRNIGIVRDGGLFVPIVGPDLKGVLARYAGDDLELGVHLRREPRRHLVVERVWSRGEEFELQVGTDKFRYRLPKLVEAQEVAIDKFDQGLSLCEVPPQDEATLTSVENAKVFVSEFYVRKAALPEPLGGSELMVASGRPTNRPQYFITSKGSDYLITNEDPMTYLMLDYLLTEDREFRGGILVEGIFDRKERVATRVAGTVEIKWIALGGPLYFRAA